jgi:phospholipid/cholesterol/gamma-HCH transport system substrate-binding protein
MARNPFRDLLRKSFLERNQKVIGLVGVIAVLVGSGFALLLSGGVFTRTYKVTAYFSDAASIAPGDQVTVAGLDAGTVKSLTIQNGQVAMTLAVDSGVHLTADTRATVKIETLLGRKSVELIDGASNRPLRDGAVIPLSRTSTPVDITTLNDISVRLLDRSDAGALNHFMSEVTKVTSGEETNVRQLVSGLADLAEAVDARRTQLSGLLDALSSLSTTLGDKSTTIVSLIDNLNPVLSDLAARETDIRNLLVATDQASHDTADLVQRNSKVLNDTLANLHTDLEVIDRHQVDLASSLAYVSQAVQGYQSVGYSQGTCGQQPPPCSQGLPNQWANIFVQSIGPVGVDALIGPCGAVDQLMSRLLGVSCQIFGKSGSGGTGGGGTGGIGGIGGGLGGGGNGGGGGGILPKPPKPKISIPPLPIPSPTLPIGLSYSGTGGSTEAAAAMPGTIEDLLKFVLAGYQGRRQ